MENRPKTKGKSTKQIEITYLAEEEYFVTALVPSDTACFASSPGKMSLTLKKSARIQFACRLGKPYDV